MVKKYKVSLKVNGVDRECYVEPGETLVNLIREDLGITGTKTACDTGDCGACTVIMDGKTVKSCITPALQADGAEITTVEGLKIDGKLHPLQEEFVDIAAVQCGYCTPGLLMTAKALLDENSNPTELEVREAIAGNICRCTGYAKPVEAILSAAEKMNGGAK
ncbi:MAG: (2Fe-2S)-binding protein [Tissierellaceae bacterium]|nr:(2Fe-2S)-binding protein [Tissierellaceae bacterium]